MAWSCQGKLFGRHKTFRLIRKAIDLIQTYNVDVLWLNDTRFTKGLIDQHIATIYELYPDCKVIQFSTTYVETGSRCEQFNQIGGAIAIVSPQRTSWVKSNHTTYPMGMGAINSIDVKRQSGKVDQCLSYPYYCHYW
jgi:hypothetical protein